MKTFFTTFSLVIFFLSSSAQKDWAITLVQPDNFKSAPDGTTQLDLEFDCELLEGSVEVGDPIIYRFRIIDTETNDTLVRMPSSGYFNSQVMYPINSSSVYTLGIEATINRIMEVSKNVIIVAESYLKNDANPIIDIDSTNNISTATARWLSEEDAASVNSLTRAIIPKMYPNPAQNEVQIELNSAEPAVFQLTDMKGALVSVVNVNQFANKAILDVRSLKDGVYILGIKQGPESYQPQRIIVKR